MRDASSRPRVLLVTRNLPPLRGGMERLNLHVVLALLPFCEVSVCGPKGSAAHLPKDMGHVVEVSHRPLSIFLLRSLVGALRLAWRRRPNVVIAGSGLTAPVAWLVARLAGARFVVYLHGLDLVASSRIYRLMWLPFIRRADLALANSGNTRSLAEERRVAPEKIAILHPGTELPDPEPGARKRFRALLGFDAEPLLLSVGRLTPRKGLAEFVQRSLPAIVNACPGAQLLIIGDDAVDAVRVAPSSERERIKHAARAAGVGDSVRFMPPCDEETLSAAYRAADVLVFPVRDVPGDVEGFGMVAVEAAARGLFTVAFRVGGVADAVVEGRTGELVSPDDHVAFAAVVVRTLQPMTDLAARSAQCRAAAAAFGWDRFGSRLRSMLTVGEFQQEEPGRDVT